MSIPFYPHEIQSIFSLTKRVNEIFGNETVVQTGLVDYIKSKYGIIPDFKAKSHCILKSTVGSVDFYVYLEKGSAVDLPGNGKIFEITKEYRQLESLQFIGLTKMIINYIMTGKRDYHLVLSKICEEEEKVHKEKAEKEKLGKKKEKENEELRIKNIEATLVKEGRLKIDEKDAEHFRAYKIDDEGYHLAI